MTNYRNVKVDWLLMMFADGYAASLCGDKQELLDAVYKVVE